MESQWCMWRIQTNSCCYVAIHKNSPSSGSLRVTVALLVDILTVGSLVTMVTVNSSSPSLVISSKINTVQSKQKTWHIKITTKTGPLVAR